MSRLPALPRDELPESQRAVHDDLAAYANSTFGMAFTYKRDTDEALVGPFPFFIASGGLGLDFLQLIDKLAALPGLSVEARETAILAVGAVYKAPYELYAHSKVAVKATKLSEDQVEQIAKGTKPDGLPEDSDAAFDVATYLASKPGALPQELWDRSVKAMGKEGTVALLHYVGFYAYTCIALNAMDARVPEDGGQSQ